MSNVIHSNQELCVGCNRCTRECPIEMANYIVLDEDERIKVRIDNTKCIACGRCISVCKHGARYYVDDMKDFFNDLDCGVEISVIAAPSIITNFPQYKRIFTWLKNKGINMIYDVSAGADICVWAHLQYMAANSPGPIITQPCASVVSYCEIHRQELLEYLSPVQSPMACTAIYMKQYKNLPGKIAALSPCIAKSNEFEDIKIIDYNVTFAKLEEYIESNNIALPVEETEFDNPKAGFGMLFPLPGGLKENIEFFVGKKLRIDCSEGSSVYKNLDRYMQTEKENLPDIFDVLNCENGCSIGSGCVSNKNIFQIRGAVDRVRQEAIGKREPAKFSEKHIPFNEILDVSHFLREYKPIHTTSADVSEGDIQNAFRLMDKLTYEQQNFNCGACGSNTCRDMARKIALKINIPINCIVKSKDDIQTEHEKNEKLYLRNTKYIELIRMIGENMVANEEESHIEMVQNSLQAMCFALNADSCSIWKNSMDEDGKYFSKEIFAWPPKNMENAAIFHEELLADWAEAMRDANALNKIKSELNDSEKEIFAGFPSGSIMAVPVMVKNEFWGVISVFGNEESLFDNEDISVTHASGLLIISNILEREIAKRKMEADHMVKTLEAVSLTDQLTGVFNRRYLVSAINEEMRSSFDSGDPMVLSMIDVDRFKSINDDFGHSYGDEVLIRLASIIKGNLGKNEIFGRYGGEEFVIIFKNSQLAQAEEKMEEIMNHIRKTEWKCERIVTISCGLSEYKKGIYFSNFIEEADRNLYKAKEGGRDMLIC